MEIIAYVFVRIFANKMHIMRIAVAQDFKSHGVATRLLRQCLKLAEEKSADAVLIEVRPTNKSAIGLYRSAGFELQGTRPSYYPDSGEDALLMVKHL
jgi:ribosomal-protein-alanine N-acetyltransferase